MLDRVARELSDVEAVAGAVKAKALAFGIGGTDETLRLVNAMVPLYTDLLHLLSKIRSLFDANGCEKRLQALRQTIRIFWVPFDEHFAHFQKRFAAHKHILQSELAKADAASLVMAYSTLKQLNSASLDHFCNVQSHLKGYNCNYEEHYRL
jgi:hypothetical protein